MSTINNCLTQACKDIGTHIHRAEEKCSQQGMVERHKKMASRNSCLSQACKHVDTDIHGAQEKCSEQGMMVRQEDNFITSHQFE